MNPSRYFGRDQLMQSLYLLHSTAEYKQTWITHPCLERDSKSPPQCWRCQRP